MSTLAHRVATIASLAAALCSSSLAGAQSRAVDSSRALPFELAFDTREFMWSTALAVSADGRRVAYDVRQPPDSNLSARYQPNGTPSPSVGSKVYITDRTTHATTIVCPGGSCWRPTWAPDGNRLAFYSDAGGAPQLWVYDLATARARRVSTLTIKAKLWTGDEPRWSTDGRTLFVPLAPASGEYRSPVLPDLKKTRGIVSVLASGSETKAIPSEAKAAEPLAAHMLRENLADLAAIDVQSGASRVIVASSTGARPSVLRLSPSGRWMSWLSVFKDHGVTNQTSSIDLGVAPTSGGESRIVAEDLPLLSDYHGLNYSWHPTEDRLVYLKDKRLFVVDVNAAGPGAPHPLGADLGDLAPTVNWFTRDGRAVVVGIDPKDDKDYGDVRPQGIAVVPLDGSVPSRFQVDVARWIYRGIAKADERTVWQPDGSSITLVLEEHATGETSIVRFDPRTGAATELWKGLARVGNLTGGGSPDALFGTYEDFGTPPNVYRFPADLRTKERVSHIDPRLDSVSVGSVEVFETTAPMHDGTLAKVRTAVLLPAHAKRGNKLPAIVSMYPGGDRSREAARFGGGSSITVPLLLFTSRGYPVVLASVTLGPNGQAGNPAQEMMDVLLPQVYRAAELGYVDIDRLAITGQSFGGYGTGAIVSRTNLFRAAVAISGIYDLPGTYGLLDETGGSFWIGWSEGGQARMGTHPWANLARYVDNSPYYQADKIHTPILLVHGDEDMAYHDAQKLFSALRRLDRPAQLATYAGQGHVISEWKRASAIDAARRMVEFYRRHLGDASAAKTNATR